ncbi:MAG: hypothetical protein HQK51_07395 [Oligoflexia bacterium]|nr:hypothetical protein [Oligoflexia bacterium]
MEDKKEKPKKKNIRALNERYTHRMTYVKQAHELKYKGDFLNAIKFYNTYLKLVAEVKDVELVNLSPKHFDIKRDLTELLLISHIYWEQVKILDRSANLEKEFRRCLEKFLEFTVGLDYQIVNAEMLRKFIRKDRNVHKLEFKEAYKRIYVDSKKCYVVSYCFGENHYITNELRNFKRLLLKMNFSLGSLFVKNYYIYSPLLVNFCGKHPNISLVITNFIFRPIILLFYCFYFVCFKLGTVINTLKHS